MGKTGRTLHGMAIKVGEIKYIIPITPIRQSLKVEKESLVIDPNGNEMVKVNGVVYNLVRLYEFFNMDTDITAIEDGIVMQLENGDNHLFVFADELIGETDITVYPMPHYLPNIAGINGCSIITDDEIYLIVDVPAFFNCDTREPTEQADSGNGERMDEEQSLSKLTDNTKLKNKFFTFEIDHEEYGIEVANIKEIIGCRKTAGIPCVPDYIEGLISLRGEVIPIINVRKRFHKANRKCDALTCIIVVNYQKYAVGLTVDSVKEVVFIEQNDILVHPSAKRNYHNPFISKLGKNGDSVWQIIDLDSFLALN